MHPVTNVSFLQFGESFASDNCTTCVCVGGDFECAESCNAECSDSQTLVDPMNGCCYCQDKCVHNDMIYEVSTFKIHGALIILILSGIDEKKSNAILIYF